MKQLNVILSLALLLAATAVSAHPGHGHSANGLWHYLTEPEHLLGVLVLLLGVSGLVYVRRRLRRHGG